MFLKIQRYQNKRLLAAAKGRACQRCRKRRDCVVPAHYSGLWSHRLGKGVGAKVHDYATAPLCSECHAYFDGYEGGNDFERAFEFLMLCMEARRDDVFSDESKLEIVIAHA